MPEETRGPLGMTACIDVRLAGSLLILGLALGKAAWTVRWL